MKVFIRKYRLEEANVKLMNLERAPRLLQVLPQSETPAESPMSMDDEVGSGFPFVPRVSSSMCPFPRSTFDSDFPILLRLLLFFLVTMSP